MDIRQQFELLDGLQKVLHSPDRTKKFLLEEWITESLESTFGLSTDTILKTPYTQIRDTINELKNQNHLNFLQKSDRRVSEQYTRKIWPSTAFVPLTDQQKKSFSQWNNPHSLYQMAHCNDRKDYLIANKRKTMNVEYKEMINIRRDWISNSLDAVERYNIPLMKAAGIIFNEEIQDHEQRLWSILSESHLKSYISHYQRLFRSTKKTFTPGKKSHRRKQTGQGEFKNLRFEFHDSWELGNNWMPKFIVEWKDKR